MRLGMVGVLLLYSCVAMATPPVEHFTRYADYEQARISPTGKYLAVTTKMDDYEYLSVIELDPQRAALSNALRQGPGRGELPLGHAGAHPGPARGTCSGTHRLQL